MCGSKHANSGKFASRAERRAGELFAELKRSPTAKGGDTRGATLAGRSSEYRDALERTGHTGTHGAALSRTRQCSQSAI